MKKRIFTRIIKITVVIILGQTLYFKFTGADESIYIFTKLGVEPYGRIGSGFIELLAAILILIRRTTLIGATLGFLTMLGAVFSHIFVLGLIVKNDRGELFTLALITLFCCSLLLFQQKNKIRAMIHFKI